MEYSLHMDMGGGILSGHGQMIRCTDWTWGEEVEYLLYISKIDNELTGHEQERLCTDWA